MSQNYVIVVDSTSDLPSQLEQQWGIEILPFIFNLDGTEYYNYPDWRDISVRAFYDALRAGKTGTTTQVTSTRYIETWTPFLEAGKDVLYLCMSSALSGSYEQSLLAQREVAETFPERTVACVDSRSASLGIGLLAHLAAKGRDEGKPLAELAAELEKAVPRVQHWVMADDLQHLRRGGRVSGAAAFVGGMLSIKPVLHVYGNGKLAPMHKARGRGKALDYLVEQMATFKPDPSYKTVYIAHSDAPDIADQLKNMVVAKYGKREIVINDIGPVIGSHTGPGTIALIFLSEKERIPAPGGK